MRVLCCPNAFKGTLTASAAAAAMARGVRAAGGWAVVMPVADGGDGTAEVLGGRAVRLTVPGPFGKPLRVAYRLRAGGEAVIEVAQVGLARVRGRNPMRASSAGVGAMIRHALDRGARKVLVALGGSATVDGGAGMSRALGGEWRDSKGRPWTAGGPPGDPAAFEAEHLQGVRFVALCDVSTRLRDCARLFGPQKGASPSDVRELSRRLEAMAQVAGVGAARQRGSGAAGGIGWALAALYGAKLVNGAEAVLYELGFHDALRHCDLVLTGEGRWDGTTREGKAPGVILRMAGRAGVPAFALCGDVKGRPRRVVRIAATAEEGLTAPSKALENRARQIVAAWKVDR